MGSDYLAWIIFAGIIVIIVLLIVQIIIFYRMSGNLANTESEIKSAIDKINPLFDKIDPLVDNADQIVNKIDPVINTSGHIVNKISPVLDYGINYYCNLSKQAYPFCPGYFAPVPAAPGVITPA